MRRPSTLLVALLSLTVAFAGCTDEADDGADLDSIDTSSIDKDSIDLGNKGAISGLVVDDNYRPVQLKEEWGNSGPGDFQDIGFVLILETGERLPTSENGEFLALPLEPGTYTIRVAADNHEAIEKQVQVVAGEFVEITLEARRTFSSGGTTLSQEEVIFIACSGNVGVLSIASIPGGCGDLSGDSERFDFDTDYTAIKEDVRGMVTEMRASQEGYYGILIRYFADGCLSSTLGDCIFAEPGVDSGNYIHVVLYPELQWTGTPGEYLEPGQDGYCVAEVDDCRNYAFNLDQSFQTALFPEAATRTYTDPGYDLANENVVTPASCLTPVGCVGLNNLAYGISLGTKAQFLQTVFLYELPEEGIEDFCALCDDADIPE